jgi:hypothetical protein
VIFFDDACWSLALVWLNLYILYQQTVFGGIVSSHMSNYNVMHAANNLLCESVWNNETRSSRFVQTTDHPQQSHALQITRHKPSDTHQSLKPRLYAFVRVPARVEVCQLSWRIHEAPTFVAYSAHRTLGGQMCPMRREMVIRLRL